MEGNVVDVSNPVSLENTKEYIERSAVAVTA